MIYSLTTQISYNPNKLDFPIESLDSNYYIRSFTQISNKHEKFILTASTLALKSNQNHKHGCVIVYKGKIISTGYNWSELGNDFIYTKHAEFDCISKIKRLRNKNKVLFNECSLYVVRINDDHNLRNSKPCNNCFDYMFKCGIKKIYYSDDIN
jgi:deoxycytidylate deaminase